MAKIKKYDDGGTINGSGPGGKERTEQWEKETGITLKHPSTGPGDDPDSPEVTSSDNSDVRLNEPSYKKGGKIKKKFKRGGRAKKEIKAEGSAARSHMGKPARKK